MVQKYIDIKSAKVKYFFLYLTVNTILAFSQNLFAQEGSNPVNDFPKAKLIESYSSFKSDEASMIIDSLKVKVDDHPNSKGFIIVYCGRICQYGEIEAHLRGITLSLRFKGIDTNRFAVISGGFQEKTATEFWYVPENACPPMPNSTVNFKDVKFKGDYKKKIVEYECCF